MCACPTTCCTGMPPMGPGGFMPPPYGGPMPPMYPPMPPHRQLSCVPPPFEPADNLVIKICNGGSVDSSIKTGKKVKAEINGTDYNVKICKDKKKKKKKTCDEEMPKFKFCDCCIPVPPCLGVDVNAKREKESEQKMDAKLTLCMEMLKEMFVRNYESNKQSGEHGQSVELPVMMLPQLMPGMGMMGGMPGMGMGMGMMGGGMPGMGMGMMGGGIPPGMVCEPGKPNDPCARYLGRKPTCKTDRDQQCDESGMKPKADGGGKKKKGKGGKKGKGKGKGKKKKKK